jgi:hypothetical protein
MNKEIVRYNLAVSFVKEDAGRETRIKHQVKRWSPDQRTWS